MQFVEHVASASTTVRLSLQFKWLLKRPIDLVCRTAAPCDVVKERHLELLTFSQDTLKTSATYYFDMSYSNANWCDILIPTNSHLVVILPSNY